MPYEHTHYITKHNTIYASVLVGVKIVFVVVVVVVVDVDRGIREDGSSRSSGSFYYYFS